MQDEAHDTIPPEADHTNDWREAVARLELTESGGDVDGGGEASLASQHASSAQVQGRGGSVPSAPHDGLQRDLTLANANIARATELRQAFAGAADGAKVGEALLLDLVGMEAGIALSLVDTEAAAVALLQRTLPVDPHLALKVAQVAREVEALSSAVRRRMQNGLAAAANLRAQRRLLELQRGSDGK